MIWNSYLYFLWFIVIVDCANGTFALVDAIKEERGYKKFWHALWSFSICIGVILTIRWVQGLLP